MATLVGQATEMLSAATEISKGRSESFVFLLAAMCIMAFMLYRDGKRHEREEAVRNNTNDRFAGSLEMVAKSTEKIEEATKVMVGGIEQLGEFQRRDRRALVSTLDAIEADKRGDQVGAERARSDARNILLKD